VSKRLVPSGPNKLHNWYRTDRAWRAAPSVMDRSRWERGRQIFLLASFPSRIISLFFLARIHAFHHASILCVVDSFFRADWARIFVITICRSRLSSMHVLPLIMKACRG
jgi:hypothetical protein